MPRIMKVLSVEAGVLKSNPPQLLVEAEGQVNTSGWKNFQLQPYIYVVPPADGMWDMDFTGDAPTGIILPVVRPAHASITVPLPKWCKGVRIHAAQNTLDGQLTEQNATFITV
jgi:hypothetical protein